MPEKRAGMILARYHPRGTPMARILVVEDEDNSAIALEVVLFRDGRCPARQFRGGAALVAIRQERPDLVLLGVMLPTRWAVRSSNCCARMRPCPRFISC